MDRKKLLADPIMVTTIVFLVTFLTLFILYPLAILLVDSLVSDTGGLTLSTFAKVLAKPDFKKAIV
ncbi:MAG: iron ABC transporter permease, partial [Coriobacteriaceae bacterium]|nr:iron ABC transporter permease [Coriobacteriaceae bacterium]